VIQSFRNIGREVSLVALLTYIGPDILEDKQLLPTPDFQRGLAGLQCPAAQVTPINHLFYFLTFRVLESEVRPIDIWTLSLIWHLTEVLRFCFLLAFLGEIDDLKVGKKYSSSFSPQP